MSTVRLLQGYLDNDITLLLLGHVLSPVKAGRWGL